MQFLKRPTDTYRYSNFFLKNVDYLSAAHTVF